MNDYIQVQLIMYVKECSRPIFCADSAEYLHVSTFNLKKELSLHYVKL